MSCELRIKFTLKHKFHRPGTHNHPLMSTQFRHKIWKLHLNNNRILKKNESFNSLICANGLVREDPFLRWKKGTALQSLWVWQRGGGQASERASESNITGITAYFHRCHWKAPASCISSTANILSESRMELRMDRHRALWLVLPPSGLLIHTGGDSGVSGNSKQNKTRPNKNKAEIHQARLCR